MKIDKATLLHIDCMEYMSGLPDKAFDLAIVDPPYGIGNFIPQTGKRKGGHFDAVGWNESTPAPEYFSELERVSIHRIIWGANYYNCFPGKGGAIVWNKNQFNPLMSGCEIASNTFYKKVDYFEFTWNGLPKEQKHTIHPCQKPVQLYEWLLTNYAKPGQRILDTHLGSGSSAIACNNLGYELVGCELDADYYQAACKRVEQATKQIRMFA